MNLECHGSFWKKKQPHPKQQYNWQTPKGPKLGALCKKKSSDQNIGSHKKKVEVKNQKKDCLKLFSKWGFFSKLWRYIKSWPEFLETLRCTIWRWMFNTETHATSKSTPWTDCFNDSCATNFDENVVVVGSWWCFQMGEAGGLHHEITRGPSPAIHVTSYFFCREFLSRVMENLAMYTYIILV